jgi:hypothetical protein
MTFNPATDFLGLWRNNAGQVSKLEIPGLDYVVAALARAGVINLSVSATAPVASQSVTAWLQAAVPSYSAEGALFLWNSVAAAYAPATPALFLDMLQATAGRNGVSWWTSVGGAPLNTVGNNGDFAIRTDEPGGIYGPKEAGAWPADPLPGTTDVLGTIGSTEGDTIFRGVSLWEALAIGPANSVMISNGTIPAWELLSALLDNVFSDVQGSILYRDAAAWEALGPGTAGYVLTGGGANANPSYTAKATEFISGTTMLFQQTSAPPGWTKQTVLNDYGLRVTNGAAGVTAGTAFSTVFAQTAVGDTTLITADIPSHTHPYSLAATTANQTNTGGTHAFLDSVGGSTTGTAGSDGPHTHSVSLTLAYVDVIIASKN